MKIKLETYNLRDEFVSVRVWAGDGTEGSMTNCGVLVMTLDEWLAFHARMYGNTRVVELEVGGVEEIMRAIQTDHEEVSGSCTIDSSSDT